MRGPDTDKLVLQERERIVAYLDKRKCGAYAWGIDHGRHLLRMPIEPQSDGHAVRIERTQAARYLRRFGDQNLSELASEIEAGKHVPDGE